MRAAGVPARVVTGYRGGELNPRTATSPCASPTPMHGPRSGCRGAAGCASTRPRRWRPNGCGAGWPARFPRARPSASRAWAA
nr:transglutaminase-like domain-containing protein [Massilia sp. Se16.2.3]